MKKSTTFQQGDLTLGYRVCGTGNKALFAFHGFGQNAEHLTAVFEHSPLYTVYCFSLFHHGESEFPQERFYDHPLRAGELKLFFEAFCRAHSIEKFDLFGFSLGGKFALQLTSLFPQNIDKLMLAAPDGLKLNSWYQFAVRTAAGRKLFGFLLNNKPVFDFLLSAVSRLKIPSKSISEFVWNGLNTQEKREFVRDVWFIYRDIAVNTDELAVKIKQHKIEVTQFYGKYDRIISVKHGRDFARKINQPQNVVELYSGHNLLSKKSVLLLREQIM